MDLILPRPSVPMLLLFSLLCSVQNLHTTLPFIDPFPFLQQKDFFLFFFFVTALPQISPLYSSCGIERGYLSPIGQSTHRWVDPHTVIFLVTITRKKLHARNEWTATVDTVNTRLSLLDYKVRKTHCSAHTESL